MPSAAPPFLFLYIPDLSDLQHEVRTLAARGTFECLKSHLFVRKNFHKPPTNKHRHNPPPSTSFALLLRLGKCEMRLALERTHCPPMRARSSFSSETCTSIIALHPPQVGPAGDFVSRLGAGGGGGDRLSETREGERRLASPLSSVSY